MRRIHSALRGVSALLAWSWCSCPARALQVTATDSRLTARSTWSGGSKQSLVQTVITEQTQQWAEAKRARREDAQIRRLRAEALLEKARASDLELRLEDNLQGAEAENAKLRILNDALAEQSHAFDVRAPGDDSIGDGGGTSQDMPEGFVGDGAEFAAESATAPGSWSLRTWSYVATGAFLAFSCCWYTGSALFHYITEEATLDADGDGDIDVDDLKKELYCGISWKALMGYMFVLTVAGVGFGGLWWANIIQQYLAPLTMCLYLAVVLGACFSIIAKDFFNRFWASLESVMQVASSIENAVAGGPAAFAKKPGAGTPTADARFPPELSGARKQPS